MEEIYTYVGMSIQHYGNVYVFFHTVKNTEIVPYILYESSAHLYNAMLYDNLLNKGDVVLILSSKQNYIQPILITHESCNMPVFSGKSMLTFFSKLLLIDRTNENSILVYKLSLHDKLNKYQHFIIFNIELITIIKKLLNNMANDISLLLWKEPIQFRSVKPVNW